MNTSSKLQKKSAYPQCQLCVENMGFAGHQTHPARQNLRPVKLNINSQDWFMQYSLSDDTFGQASLSAYKLGTAIKISELVFIAKKWYNRRYEKRISSNKLRK